ncbi:HAD-IIB family hydrolase [Rhizobium sp. CG5]|uniref:HAD-IIB family hydrolase n=1 Tax=Rhizobium sp. CG5 TaxID=2726076 RepID=UPI0020339B44|nr:HAD-IIB family hydrolase [Rhizobium sp. CG5]MCM2472931.1 HAD-IIB family hydrolase [Rhizobium sp. CG5]
MKPVRLFSSDLDGTLAGNRDASKRFADFWARLDDATRPVLVYNSGRLVDDILAFTEQEGLPRADIVIGGVGTMLASPTHADLSEHYGETLGANYDADRIAAIMTGLPGVERQPERYQHARKSSWFLHDASTDEVKALERRLIAAGLAVKLVYSSKRDLDVLPGNADKGQALRWLCDRLGIGLDEVVVAGDAGNDRAMFELDMVRGVIPANGHAELVTLCEGNPRIVRADRPEADGVMEGLRHWGVAPSRNS